MRTLKQQLARLAVVTAAVLPGALVFHGCSTKRRTETVNQIDGPHVQVERLGRPAVNEGLVVTNDFLNAFNSITPADDLTVFTTNTAFANEIAGNLAAFDGLENGGVPDDVNAGDVVQAFLPDVMRVDTTLACPVGTTAYSNGALVVGSVVRPIGGRKLEDDVVDITLTLLISGNSFSPAISDNVDYRDGTLDDGAGQPDHDLLNGQAAPLGAATFPFLAAAN